LPEAELLDLGAQMLLQLFLLRNIVDDGALERDQLALDELAQVVLQEPQLLGQLKVHFVLTGDLRPCHLAWFRAARKDYPLVWASV
jgi:hypothetical protein